MYLVHAESRFVFSPNLRRFASSNDVAWDALPDAFDTEKQGCVGTRRHSGTAPTKKHVFNA
jgi:hypothetical protein